MCERRKRAHAPRRGHLHMHDRMLLATFLSSIYTTIVDALRWWKDTSRPGNRPARETRRRVKLVMPSTSLSLVFFFFFFFFFQFFCLDIEKEEETDPVSHLSLSHHFQVRGGLGISFPCCVNRTTCTGLFVLWAPTATFLFFSSLCLVKVVIKAADCLEETTLC